jgi:phage-related protein
MSDEMNKFLSAQSKMNTLAKEQGKSLNILNIKYKLINKTLGPFYRKYVDLKNTAETIKDVFEEVGEGTEKLAKATNLLLKPITGVLKAFTSINTIMIFVLGAFALVGAALFLLTKSFGGGESAVSTFGMVIEAGKGVLDAFMGVVSAVIDAVGGIDFEASVGAFIPFLEGIFAFLGNILTLYLTLIGAILTGIGDIVTRMDEAGMFQRIVDAFGTFFGLVGMSLGIIMGAFDETGVTMDDLISGISNTVSGFVDFLFNSGLIEFAVQVIEYVAVFYGALAVVIASVIALYIKIWTIIGPPLVRFVKAFFSFLEPIIRIVTGIIGVIMKAIMGLIGWLAPYFEVAMDGLMDILGPILEVISDIIDGAATALSYGGDLLGGAADFMGFSDGGVASGPTSGYPVALHGTEAIVPLPDGRTIPVSIKGDLGGGSSNTNNITINVSGGGNAKEIAKAVSDEISKVMRNRSRGGNYTRGVI